MRDIEPKRLFDAYHTACEALLAQRNGEGYWVGELSTSALSTATAVCALGLVHAEGAGDERLTTLVRGGIGWLAANQNADGGWGDTPKSLSDISTTMLARAAIDLTGRAGELAAVVAAADGYIAKVGGIEAVRARYGKDRTFAVPILMTCALAGQVPWRDVSALPFELAALPPETFKCLKLPVVSYALPALIAVGQVKYASDPPRNLLVRLLRRGAVQRSLRVLEKMQPSSGGYLEAVPLTSFVTMALAGMGRAEHPVARRAVAFLVASVRPDGSWPIDSNLSVWLTTLSANALSHPCVLPRPERTRQWLLDRQYRELHPYTNAAPGGWGWTHLPGSVPDADDTAGALLALANLGFSPELIAAAEAASDWLLNLQNRDGGWPTFCRGWGHLLFDRSGADLTAHALRALNAANAPISEDAGSGPTITQRRVQRAMRNGLAYLARSQRSDGAWVPLWFGNQHAEAEQNPTYATARVLLAYRDLGLLGTREARQGVAWFVAAQNPDGGWGAGSATPSTIEETALALEALAEVQEETVLPSVQQALHWLIPRVEDGSFADPSPIGFYFAKLWYYERLYPLIFTVGALGRLVGREQSDAGVGARNADWTGRLLKTELRSG